MSSPLTLLSHSEADTDALGAVLAESLTEGLTIAFNGELGSGKTRFVRALCAGLGIDTRTVNSPTFVIMQQYTDGRIPVAHIDTYRLADVDEFLATGADEYLESEEWLTVVEWADRISEVLPEDCLQIDIRQVGETAREFRITAFGPRSRVVLDAMSQSPRLSGRK